VSVLVAHGLASFDSAQFSTASPGTALRSLSIVTTVQIADGAGNGRYHYVVLTNNPADAAQLDRDPSILESHGLGNEP
jgi:hypothetical protein